MTKRLSLLAILAIAASSVCALSAPHDIAVRHAELAREIAARSEETTDPLEFDLDEEEYANRYEDVPLDLGDDDNDSDLETRGELDVVERGLTTVHPGHRLTGHGLVGLDWGGANSATLKHWNQKTLGAIYTWSPRCPDVARDYCCVMFWGTKSISAWKTTLKKYTPPCVMGMNEPDLGSQSSLSASKGIALWKQYVLPVSRKGAWTVSPVVSQSKKGKPWLTQFFKCKECRDSVDVLALHVYVATTEKFIAYVTDMHKTFGKDIWVTEMACTDFSPKHHKCSAADAKALMNGAKAFMKKTPWLREIFWFGFFSGSNTGVSQVNSLMNGNGTPRTLGSHYVAA